MRATIQTRWDAARARAWARRRLRRRDAVIIDTETTDLHGEIVQLAVIDLTGTPLLDTLVRPTLPIAPDATAVHGITDADVADAAPFVDVVPTLLAATRGKQLLAYNAPYDRDVLTRALADAGLSDPHLADPRAWGCLMRARSRCTGQPWARLGGNHQALGDCLAALDVLHRLPWTQPGAARDVPPPARQVNCPSSSRTFSSGE